MGQLVNISSKVNSPSESDWTVCNKIEKKNSVLVSLIFYNDR